MNKTPIVMIIDSNAVEPFSAAVSGLSRSISEPVEVVAIGVSPEDKPLEKVARFYDNNISIRYIDASFFAGRIAEYVNNNAYVTNTALLKFYIPELLPEYDRALYLDVDLIIRQDLSELLRESIDGFYAGVVKNLVCPNDDPKDVTHKPGSFNSGVMLLNCKKLREEKITEKLLLAKSGLWGDTYVDQTAFNIVFSGKVKYLPLKYNYIPLFNLHSVSELNAYYGTDYRTSEEMFRDITILHLAGRYKPWKYIDGYYFKEWMEHYGNSFLASPKDITPTAISRGERKLLLFTVRYWQGIALLYMGNVLLLARYHDGLGRKVRLLLNAQRLLSKQKSLQGFL